MSIEQFNEAIQIISVNHSSVVKINTPINRFVSDMGQTFFRLHIIECVPAVVNNLIEADFMLSMTADGLMVEKV